MNLCPKCKRKLVVQRRGLQGAWWCDHCESAFHTSEVESSAKAGDHQAKVVRGPWQ